MQGGIAEAEEAAIASAASMQSPASITSVGAVDAPTALHPLSATAAGAVGPGLSFPDEESATAVRAAFAEAENRRRTYEARVKRQHADEARRAAEQHDAQVQQARADRRWAEGREERKQHWLDFAARHGGKRRAGEEAEAPAKVARTDS